MFKANFNLLNKIFRSNFFGVHTNLKSFSTINGVNNENMKNYNENIFTYLNERKLVSNISHQELLNGSLDIQAILKKNSKMYIGFDPTAESLHLGNLIGILTAIRFAGFGIEPVFLLGGATGQIGDPSGKNKERPLLHKEKIQNNLAMIEDNIKNIMENITRFSDIQFFCKSKAKFANKLKTKESNSPSGSDEEERTLEVSLKKINDGFLGKNILSPYEDFIKKMEMTNRENKLFNNHFIGEQINYQIINNFEFYKDLNIIDFLREAGVNLRMGPLLSRETVKNRLNTKEGLSLTEFMYQTFQGYDYLKLFEKFGVRVQIGGSDQWGNMLAGYELIKKMKNSEVVNMTFPLMTTANGQKFGKSEGNAIFLNPKISPINSVFQYFYNLADADLNKMFNAFSFVENEEIEEIIHTHNKCPEKRIAQKILAEKVVGMLFSEDEAVRCRNNCEAHYTNFSKFDFNNSTENSLQEIENLLKNCQVTEICEDSLEKLSVSNLCVNQKILTTKAQCKRLIQSGSVSINNNKIHEDVCINKEMLIGGRYFILKTGKKHSHIFEIKKKEFIIEELSLEHNISTSLNKIKE